MTIRQHTIFRGHVQGVGFRATAARVAEGFEVAGHVRNLADGSVELVVEGNDTEVKAFLETSDQLPEWHDDALVRRGQLLFEQWAPEIGPNRTIRT